MHCASGPHRRPSGYALGVQVELTKERRAARRGLARRGVVILYEDNHLLCISKPSGLLSQPGPPGEISLPEVLGGYRQQAENKPGKGYVGLVHRLDRNVSGAMVVAKTSKAAARLSKLFHDRDPALRKSYIAWIENMPQEDSGALVHRLRREGGVTRLAGAGDPDGKEARLRYEVVATGFHAGQPTARVLVKLETGLSHQIRAQFSIVGHPLVGDAKYGSPQAKRVALHASSLAFPHPIGGDIQTIEAPVPEDLVLIDTRLQMDPPV